MITTKTVLVLGAGASAPYGFPTGCELMTERIPASKNDDLLLRTGIASAKLQEFKREVQGADMLSIDKFLELRPEFLDVGRLVLACIFLQGEYKSLSGDRFNFNIGEHWYGYLKTRMEGAFADIGSNKLKVITFNYDRSLEHYLCTTLSSTYGKTNTECAAELAHIEILHVYGSLGPLPWESPANSVPYGMRNALKDMVRRASPNIKVMHEGSDSAEVGRNFEKAKKWLTEAERVLFLGFGFHEENVERLALREFLRQDQDIKATCKGLDLTRKDAAQFCTSWSRRPTHVSGRAFAIDFADPEADCYTFLHKFAILS